MLPFLALLLLLQWVSHKEMRPSFSSGNTMLAEGTITAMPEQPDRSPLLPAEASDAVLTLGPTEAGAQPTVSSVLRSDRAAGSAV